jgi:hypothetical protein
MRINARRGERLGNAVKQALVCLFYECSFGMAGCSKSTLREPQMELGGAGPYQQARVINIKNEDGVDREPTTEPRIGTNS